MDRIGEPFGLARLGRDVLRYANVSEDGPPISEWAVAREDLATFLGRR